LIWSGVIGALLRGFACATIEPERFAGMPVVEELCFGSVSVRYQVGNSLA